MLVSTTGKGTQQFVPFCNTCYNCRDLMAWIGRCPLHSCTPKRLPWMPITMWGTWSRCRWVAVLVVDKASRGWSDVVALYNRDEQQLVHLCVGEFITGSLHLISHLQQLSSCAECIVFGRDWSEWLLIEQRRGQEWAWLTVTWYFEWQCSLQLGETGE